MKKLFLISLIFLFGCESTKKVASSSTTEQVKTEESVKTTVSEQKITEDISEVITETITERTVIKKDDLGNEIRIPESTTQRKIERFNKKSGIKTESSELKSEHEVVEISSTEDLTKETKGQDAAKIVKSATKGITSGIFDSIFGEVFQKIAGAILIIIFLVFLSSIRKKKLKS